MYGMGLGNNRISYVKSHCENMLTRKEIDFPYGLIWISTVPSDVCFFFSHG